MKHYKIVFHGGANAGSRAVDAIASSVQGDWTNAVSNYDGKGHDVAFVSVPDENAGYLEQLLDGDARVVAYECEDDSESWFNNFRDAVLVK